VVCSLPWTGPHWGRCDCHNLLSPSHTRHLTLASSLNCCSTRLYCSIWRRGFSYPWIWPCGVVGTPVWFCVDFCENFVSQKVPKSSVFGDETASRKTSFGIWRILTAENPFLCQNLFDSCCYPGASQKRISYAELLRWGEHSLDSPRCETPVEACIVPLFSESSESTGRDRASSFCRSSRTVF
jgi:hypothetical protein